MRQLNDLLPLSVEADKVREGMCVYHLYVYVYEYVCMCMCTCVFCDSVCVYVLQVCFVAYLSNPNPTHNLPPLSPKVVAAAKKAKRPLTTEEQALVKRVLAGADKIVQVRVCVCVSGGGVPLLATSSSSPSHTHNQYTPPLPAHINTYINTHTYTP